MNNQDTRTHSASYNAIYVIESLAEDDQKTGRELAEDELASASIFSGVQIVFREPSNRNEFLGVLAEILAGVETQGHLPLIHIECHGNDDGMRLGDGSYIEWSELYDHLVQINAATRNNLIVVMAMCKGAHFIQQAMPTKRAPFAVLVGLFRDVDEKIVRRGFSRFYQELIRVGRADAAVDYLNAIIEQEPDKFRMFPAEVLLVHAFRGYLEGQCNESALVERAKAITEQSWLKSEIRRHWNNDKTQLLVYSYLQISQGHDVHFEQIKRTFLFIDQYPEIANRYTITYEDVVGL